MKGKKANKKDATIFGLIEAKYLRNIHRWEIEKKKNRNENKQNAMDEINEIRKSLIDQLHRFDESRHGDYRVKLNSETKEIYGLIFASYIYNEKKGNKRRKYIPNI